MVSAARVSVPIYSYDIEIAWDCEDVLHQLHQWITNAEQ